MASVYLDPNDTFTVSNNNTKVFGTTGAEVITVAAGVTGVTFDQGVERVALQGNSSTYTYQQQGINLVIYSGTTVVATVPLQNDANGTQITFANGTVNALVGSTGMTLGGTAVVAGTTSTTATTPTPATVDTTVVTPSTAPVSTVPTFSVTGAAAAAEGTTASFTVALTNRAAGTSYAVTTALTGTGGATAGTDFASTLTLDATSIAAGISLTNGVLTVPASSTVSSVTLTTAVMSDLVTPETGEGLSLALTNATGTGITIGTSSATTTITDVVPAPITYTLTSSAASVYEGATLNYTLTASRASLTDTSVAFSVVVGDAAAANQGTNNTNLNDFLSGSFNPSTVVIPAGQTTASYSVVSATDTLTELPENYSVKAVIGTTTFNSNAVSLLDGTSVNGGQTFTLTTSVDNGAAFTGTSANDIFNSVPFTIAAGTTVATFTALDSLDGGDGNDTLTIVDTTAAFSVPTSATVKNIETASITASGTVTGDMSGWTGLTSLKVGEFGGTTATGITTAATTDVTLTDSALATATASVLGAKNVTVTANGVTGAGTVNVGKIGAVLTPVAGTVNVTTNMLATNTGAVTAAAINVNGGTTVTIDANLNELAGVGNTVTGGAIGVTGTASTTTVTVNQTAPATAAAAVVAATGVIGVAALAAAPGVKGTSLVAAATPATAKAAVAGVVNGAVTITDSALTAAGSIKTVTLSNTAAGSTISSNALTDLTLNGTNAGLTLTRTVANASDTLNLNLNGTTAAAASVGTIIDTNNEIKTLNVTTDVNNATLAGFTDTGLTTLNVAGSKVLSMTTVTPTLTKLAVTGAAGFTGDISGLAGLATGFTTTSSGVITATLNAATQTFTGSTGQDIITIGADALFAIKGGSAATDVLVLNNTAATFNAAANVTALKGITKLVTGFETLGTNTTSQGIFDISTLPVGLKDVRIFGNPAAALSFTKLATGAALQIDTTTTQTIGYQVANATGASDTATVTLGKSTNTTGITVSSLTMEDSNNVGIGTLNVVSNASTWLQTNTITTLVDNGLSTLNVSGNASLVIGANTQVSTHATNFTINNTLSGADDTVTITTLTDANLGALTFTGSAGSTVSSLAGLTGKVLTVSNTGTGEATLTAITASAGTSVATETNTVTFAVGLAPGQSATVAGRTVTNTSGTATATATDVAVAMSGGAVAAGLTVSGTLGGWTAAVTATTAVVFTSTTANTNVPNISAAAGTLTTAGLTAPTAVAAGTKTIDGDGAAVTEKSAWTMQGLTNGQSVTVDGDVLTAQRTLTATEVAEGFTAGATSAGNFTFTNNANTSTGLATPWTTPTWSNVGAVLTLTNTGFTNVTDLTSIPTINSAGAAPAVATPVETVPGVATATAGAAQALETITLAGNVDIGANGPSPLVITSTAGVGSAEPAIGSSTVGVTVNGATNNGHVNMTFNGAASGIVDNITLGNGNNLITNNSTAGTVNVTVGTGYNVIDVNAGANNATFHANVTLGAHTNTTALYNNVLASVTGSQVESFSTAITGAVAGDVITFNTALDQTFYTLTAAEQATITAASSLANAVTAAFAVTSVVANTATAFQYGGNTYIIDDVDGTGFTAGTDSVVKLTGLHTVQDFGTVAGAVAVLS